MVAASNAEAQSSTVSNEIISQFVDSGKRSRIWKTWNIDASCNVVHGFNNKIDTLPQYGMASVERIETEVTPGMTRSHRFNGKMRENIRKCVGKRVPTLQVFYQPRPGFIGFDRMTFVITSFNGLRVQNIDVRLAVR